MPGILNVGVIGLGRMGAVYARYLAHRVPDARLVAVADSNADRLREFADEIPGVRMYADHRELLDDHGRRSRARGHLHQHAQGSGPGRGGAGKAIFCEKPISLALDDAYDMRHAVEKAGVFFHAGFQRRFDAGYLAAKRKWTKASSANPW